MKAAMTQMVSIYLNSGCERRLQHGHPWIYSNEIRMDGEAKALPSGTCVTVRRHDGKPLAIATFTPHSLIAGRVLSRELDTKIDQDFLRQRLQKALELRERLFPVPHYRLIHAEADGLPGLILDRFDKVVTLQINTAGMELLLDDLLVAVDSVLSPEVIVLRNDTPAREMEGLELYSRVVKGELSGPVEVIEHGVRFYADPLNGQKTGWFFDQRDNRAFLAGLTSGQTVLDVYSYAGGFGVSAAVAGAKEVTIVDRSDSALALAQQGATLNGVEGRCHFVRNDAFRELEKMNAEERRFGVVSCDPPAFVKSRKDLKAGLRGYRKLAILSAPLVEPGGFLYLASCSHNAGMSDFLQECTIGIGKCGRDARLIRQAGAAPDHPVLGQLPESAYLKGLVFQLD